MKTLQKSLQNFEGCMASRLQIFRARDKINMEKGIEVNGLQNLNQLIEDYE